MDQPPDNENQAFISLLISYPESSAKGPDPVAVKGIIDLREISNPENFIVNLNGEWEFYWKKMLRPYDFDALGRNQIILQKSLHTGQIMIRKS